MRLCSGSFGIADSEKKKEEEDEDEDEDEDEEEDDYRNLKKKIITRFDARGGEAAEKKNRLQRQCAIGFSKFGRLSSNFFVLRLDGAPYGRGVANLLPYVFRYFSYIHSLHHRRPLILIMILTIASLLNRLIEL